MSVPLRSDWQDLQVKLQKTLHGYELAKVNRDTGIVDYIAENNEEGKKLLRVIVDPQFNASKAYMETVTETLDNLEEGYYDEATIIADGFTKASRERIREEEDLEGISNKYKPSYSIVELYEAILKTTKELCEAKCGKFPTREEDCEGYQDGEYTCPVRRISDDVDFHVERNWNSLLMNDFSRLVDLREQIV